MHYTERSEIVASHSNAPYVHFLKRLGLNINVVTADGATVTDANGLCYLDCIAGYGNCFVGHNPRPIIDAVVAEIQSPRPFNLPFISEVQARLFQKTVRSCTWRTRLLLRRQQRFRGSRISTEIGEIGDRKTRCDLCDRCMAWFHFWLFKRI